MCLKDALWVAVSGVDKAYLPLPLLWRAMVTPSHIFSVHLVTLYIVWHRPAQMLSEHAGVIIMKGGHNHGALTELCSLG